MPSFRKKPVAVEAFQMTKERRWDNSEWPNWLHNAWNTEGEGALYCVDGGEDLFIGTLEGVHAVKWGDWIIQGVAGEIYPCKPDIFEKTYESESTPVKCQDCADLKSRLASVSWYALNMDIDRATAIDKIMRMFTHADFTCPGCAEKDKQIADYRIRIEQSIRNGGDLLEQIAERDARLAVLRSLWDEGIETPTVRRGIASILSNVEPALLIEPIVRFGEDETDSDLSMFSVRAECPRLSAGAMLMVWQPRSTGEETK